MFDVTGLSFPIMHAFYVEEKGQRTFESNTMKYFSHPYMIKSGFFIVISSESENASYMAVLDV